MASGGIEALYPDHLRTLAGRADRALAAGGYDGLLIGSGSLRYHYLDDRPYPFKANPHYQHWVPEASPDCFVAYRPGSPPRLVFHQPEDYWHLPPARPEGYWVGSFDLEVVREPGAVRDIVRGDGRWAVLGEPSPVTAGLGDADPAPVLGRLEYARAAKTPYEIECLARASATGARAHRAAEAAFRDGASEYQVHLEYCRSARARDEELPYNNIIGFDAHAAVLHYQHLDRERPPGVRSFLIDAGTCHAGYACDITRTHATAPGGFADLIEALDRAQQALVLQVRPGTDYREIHLAAHHAVAGVLVEAGLVTGSAEAAVASRLTSVFFPHGIGHLLGLQVHDVGGFMADESGGERPRPPGHPYLRLTRELAAGFVVTIEPGVYFIDSLLAEAASDRRRQSINWERVEALKPCGGVRIEDDVVATAQGPRNLTREAFAAA